LPDPLNPEMSKIQTVKRDNFMVENENWRIRHNIKVVKETNNFKNGRIPAITLQSKKLTPQEYKDVLDTIKRKDFNKYRESRSVMETFYENSTSNKALKSQLFNERYKRYIKDFNKTCTSTWTKLEAINKRNPKGASSEGNMTNDKEY
jgi:hypothetical protein